ncbi:DUF6485 family protein [candidate division CSSED10-310 bacterium]|uniref:DUF6485 family protein n=1 Tax=candidate division CSSED10-310 bacterium TaxID=2855610 RepID=A0ABV6Z465_UNCC1
MECEHLQQNLKICNCTYDPCPRKGNCCLCLHYHRRMGELPACYFTETEEATYNRSISYFVSRRKR